MTHTLRSTIRLPVQLEKVFAFFADARNLERITPPELRFRIVSPQPIGMKAGVLIDYRLELLGVSFDWQAKITRWNPPHGFVDEQVRGPYKVWIHTHRFSRENGLTRIEDEVNYRLPLWPIGECSYPFVHLHLQRIFRWRRRAIMKAFEAG